MKLAIPLLALAVVVAAQQPAAADDKKEALAHIKRGTALHQDGHYAEALEEMSAAYSLDPRPELLYAIGQLHVKLGDCPKAILFYQRFLASRPARRAAGATKEAIKVCKKHPPPAAAVEPTPTPTPEPAPAPAPEPAPAPVVTPEPTPDPAPAPSPPFVDDGPPPAVTYRTRPWYTDVVADVALGTGIALGVLSGLEYKAALSDLDAADSATSYEDHAAKVDSARTARIYAVGFGATAGLLITAGVVRILVHDRRQERRIGVAPARGGGVLVLGGSF